MIRCFAVDDEVYASEIVANFIEKTNFLTLVGTTTDAFYALKLIEEGEIDLVFLDIQMPELNGIQFMKICGTRCKIILTTAYAEHALESFDLDAIDYLLKPISYERFYRSALKAKHFFNNIEKDATEIKKHGVITKDFIFIKGDAKNKYIKINYDDILYVEGLNNYVSFYTVTGERIITYQSLKELENQLPKPLFYRVHKSYIISTKHIRQIEGNSIFIINKSLPLGESYRDSFFKMIKEKNSSNK